MLFQKIKQINKKVYFLKDNLHFECLCLCVWIYDNTLSNDDIFFPYFVTMQSYTCT